MRRRRGVAGVWWGRSPVVVVRLVAAVAVLLGVSVVLPASAVAASGYDFADGARRVDGADGTADAERLVPGTTYRSSLPSGGKVHYRLELDDVSSVYVAATAVPRPGSRIAAVDGVRVAVQDTEGRSCSFDTASFGAARSPHPIAAWGLREISPGKPLCQEAGTYYVSVERVEPADTSPGTWDLELTVASEPGRAGGGATSPPGAWDSASPEPVGGAPEHRAGGTGFGTAADVGQGVWSAEIEPGGTLFYEVPVDWGQQLSATAELGDAKGGSGYAVSALELALYNPARGHVQGTSVGYDGTRKAASLAPVPPVEYANRHAATEQVNTVRFAGSYYLVVHVAEEVAAGFGDGPIALTLRVGVRGAAHAGPGYAGESEPRGLFEVSEEEREAAAEGGSADDDLVMTLLAAGGIGTGSALLVGLGVWRALGQRRVRAQKPTA